MLKYGDICLNLKIVLPFDFELKTKKSEVYTPVKHFCKLLYGLSNMLHI